ncbi:S8 family serine peptidase [Epibacterium ulvae]|uniref:S8 family serine peptidase n=1 Tax=Epibacterium ulvae TaxID=1156985 RepID=UPI001BFC09D9|nr:S8 family serine peptidase [Epibacterium ulvae]MBT8155915.1 S8 family serine peptidase [Epibacterium ulvae]
MSQVEPNTSRVQEFLEDPRINDSWYLESSDRSALSIEIEQIWEEYTGQDVTVGVIDSQIDFNHVDLSRAYDETLDYDFDQDTSDISINSKYMTDHHGTMVAGMIAAEGGNGVGSVGISPDATLVGLAINYSSSDVGSQVIDALKASAALDVVNNSWSFTANFRDNFALSSYSAYGEALEFVAETGRDGLGTAVVFSAGNSGIEGSSNYHNFQNSPYTIAVGAVERSGEAWDGTSLGANVLLSAAGHQAVTTYSNDRYALPSGTSFAAPQVSGAIALMLEANPDLGYRDIQQILALSATREGLSDDPLAGDGWLTNGATNMNGGGMHFSDAFGYGFLNVHNAVRLAETWDLQQTTENRDTLVQEQDFDLAMEAGTTDHIQATFTVDETVKVEHVQVSMGLKWTNNGDLDIYLTSPDGTTVRLVYDSPDASYIGGLSNFSLTSVASMGELSDGEWTIDIYNRDPSATNSDGTPMTGTLASASLTIHGEADDLADDTYYYTDEFGSLYEGDDLAERSALSDTDGGTDTINAAAVTSSSLIDLSGESATIIAGVELQLDTPSNIENAYTGDGWDYLVGSAADNVLSAGRGNDMLVFSAGQDVLDGGAGEDTVHFDFKFADVYGYISDAQTLFLGVVDFGLSTVAGVESFSFYDVTYSLAELTERLGSEDDVPDEPAPVDEPADEGGTEPPAEEEETPDPVDEPPTEPVEETVVYDEIYNGTAAADTLRGSSLNDDVNGAEGNDIIFGFAGDDLLVGGEGDDRIKGGDDNDILRGEDGSDALFGGAGDDLLEGGADNDKLIGHEGNDTLVGGAGRDVLRGDEGADTYVFDLEDADTLDVLFGFSSEEGDTIVVEGLDGDDDVTFDLLFKDNGSVFLEAEVNGETTRLAKLVDFQDDDLTVEMGSGDTSAFLF